MTTDDTAGKPRKTKDRLAAMQARHAAPEPAPAAAPEPASAAAGGSAGSLMGDLQAAMAGGQGGRAAIMQRLRQALSGPDGKIDPQRARMALMFVRKQASDPAAPRHELAKRIEGMVRNMPPQQRQRLMAAAGMGGAGGGKAGLAGGFGAKFGGGQGKGVGKGLGAGRSGAEVGARPEGAQAPAGATGSTDQGAPWFDNFLDKI